MNRDPVAYARQIGYTIAALVLFIANDTGSSCRIMENHEQSLQPQPSMNVSPAVVMFFVLAALLVLVGLYVTNRDIETQGVTVLESTAPLQFESSQTRLAGRYPDGWHYDESADSVIFTPANARSDDPTAIIVARLSNQPDPDVVINQIENNAQSVIDEADSYDQLPDGVTITVRENDTLEARHIVFSDGEGGLFTATLRSENVNRYDDELEAVAQTLGFVRAFPLTQRAVRPDFSVPYPEGFTDTPQDARVIFLSQTAEGIDDSDAIIIQLILAAPAELISPEYADATTTESTLFIGDQLAGATPETEAYPVKLGGYFGSRMLLGLDSNPEIMIQLTVLDVGDGNFLLILARTPRENYTKLDVTLDAMIADLDYVGGLASGVGAVNNVRSIDDTGRVQPATDEPVTDQPATDETSSAEPPDVVFEGEALELTQVAERPTFAVNYPTDWLDANNAGDSVIPLFENQDNNLSLAIQFIVGTPDELFGPTDPDATTDTMLFLTSQAFPGFQPVSDIVPASFAGYDGHELGLISPNDTQQIAGLWLFDLRDGNYLLISSRSSAATYGTVRATVAAMMDTFSYQDPEATPADEATDTTEAVEPAGEENASVEGVNDIRDGENAADEGAADDASTDTSEEE